MVYLKVLAHSPSNVACHLPLVSSDTLQSSRASCVVFCDCGGSPGLGGLYRPHVPVQAPVTRGRFPCARLAVWISPKPTMTARATLKAVVRCRITFLLGIVGAGYARSPNGRLPACR